MVETLTGMLCMADITAVDSLVPPAAFKRLMGWTLALAMAVMFWSEFGGRENKWMDKWWYSAVFGLLGGFTTMIGNAAGPVMAVTVLAVVLMLCG